MHPVLTCGRNQAVEFARANIHRAKDVGVFARQHALAKWAYGLGSPAPTHVRDAPKARLVLKHQLDGLILRPLFADFSEDFGEFSPLLLSHMIAFGMAFVGREFSPVVAL